MIGDSKIVRKSIRSAAGTATDARQAASNLRMTLDLEKAGKPLRKLRKLLKAIGPEPSPDEVHKLRTSTRKLEASLHTLPHEGGKNGRRAIKSLKPVRRLAGKVRDMDVLMAKASPLCNGEGCDALVRLLQELADKRKRAAHKLHKVIEKRSSTARRALRATLEKLQSPHDLSSENLLASPQTLADQLQHWPKLHKENLHDFRKGVKELRYMLQLFEGADEEQIAAFARVKDAVGEWHDWLELQHAAEQVFDRQQNPVLHDIRMQTRQKLREAMTAANALRRNGFELATAA